MLGQHPGPVLVLSIPYLSFFFSTVPLPVKAAAFVLNFSLSLSLMCSRFIFSSFKSPVKFTALSGSFWPRWVSVNHSMKARICKLWLV